MILEYRNNNLLIIRVTRHSLDLGCMDSGSGSVLYGSQYGFIYIIMVLV